MMRPVSRASIEAASPSSYPGRCSTNPAISQNVQSEAIAADIGRIESACREACRRVSSPKGNVCVGVGHLRHVLCYLHDLAVMCEQEVRHA